MDHRFGIQVFMAKVMKNEIVDVESVDNFRPPSQHFVTDPFFQAMITSAKHTYGL